MSILLYVKLIQCSVFPQIYAQIRGGGGVSLPRVYVHSSICETYLVQCFFRDLCLIGGGGGVSLPRVQLHSSICKTYLVQQFSRDLCSIGGWDGSWVHLPSVYVNFSICATVFGVVVFQRSMCDWRRGSICTRYGSHCSIGYTGLVQQGSIHLGSISRGGPPHFSICYTGLVYQGSVHLGSISRGLFISQQVILHWCSRAPYTWGQLAGGGPPHFSICYTGLVYQGSVHLGSISRGPIHFSIGHTTLVQQGSTLGLNWQGSTSVVQQGSVDLGLISRRGPPHFSIGYTLFGVVGLCTLGVHQWGRASSFLNTVIIDFVQQGSVHLGLISRRGPPHFSIGSTGLLQQGSVHLGSISRLASSFPNQLYSFGIVGICTLRA